jgi:sialic acid synthase SpsE
LRAVRIGDRLVGPGQPCYIVAEIGSNFDGDLDRAKELASLAKDCGADAAKFQSFSAEKIVRAEGFAKPEGFQAGWSKSVWEVYKDAEFPPEWHGELKEHCEKIGIDFFSSPYDSDALRLLEDLGVPAHKVGSGELNNLAFLREVAATGKPIVLATGASSFSEVARAVEEVRGQGCEELVLLQCITNYPSRFESAELLAMARMGDAFDVPVGYSDHTPGYLVPVGAVALGACMIEKHFTDDCSRSGPDHPFAMDPDSFRTMVEQVRLMEAALGTGEKRVMPEEKRTRVLQRRGVWVVKDLTAGSRLARDDLALLRPATGLPPEALEWVVGRTVARDVPAGTPLTEDLMLA